MQDDRPSRRKSLRWTVYVAALAAGVLLAMSVAAVAQDGTTTTDTTETETSPQGTPEIPEGFDPEDCNFEEQEDGSTSVTCTREEGTATAEQTQTETVITEDDTITTEVVPVGGTAAGGGGTAGEDRGVLPFVLGGAGLALALTAALLGRRRRLE